MSTPHLLLGERVATADTIHAVANLLARFADVNHPALQDPKFARKVYAGTGVIVERTWADNPALVLFCFFVTGRRGSPEEVNFLMSVEFDQEHFHAAPTVYIANMVKETSMRIVKATEDKSTLNVPVPVLTLVSKLPDDS